MTYVIVQNCCNDASCVDVCPVDCIHPTPDEPDFLTAEMLYINPADCIDCGACVDACPVGAIHADYDLPSHHEAYLAVNEEYFSWMAPPPPTVGSVRGAKLEQQSEPVRVAVVGAGPSGWYVADELISSDRAEVEVTVLDRLPVSHGLVRHGVAPDHQDTKQVGETFDKTASHIRVDVRLGVEVGTDVSHQELLEHHHAVVYCTGAAEGRRLGIPGEELPGAHTSADFVHWYNGHPDHSANPIDLSGNRAVIIGNGNVALDIARILLTPADQLARTDIAEHALEAIRSSAVQEVIILGRRGAEHAAFTSPELRSMLAIDGLDVCVEGHLPAEAAPDETIAGFATAQKIRLLQQVAGRNPNDGSGKRLVFRFDATPLEVVGDLGVRGVRVRSTESAGPETEVLEADLVVTAIGYRSSAVPGVAFDVDQGRFAQERGRVADLDGARIPGVYTSGWAKRGPSGVIGTNRGCAAQTVAALLDDLVGGRLTPPATSRGDLDELFEQRGVRALDAADWRSLAAIERARGQELGRPRLKVLSRQAVRSALDTASATGAS